MRITAVLSNTASFQLRNKLDSVGARQAAAVNSESTASLLPEPGGEFEVVIWVWMRSRCVAYSLHILNTLIILPDNSVSHGKHAVICNCELIKLYAHHSIDGNSRAGTTGLLHFIMYRLSGGDSY